MGEQMVILALVPRAVDEQSVLQMVAQSRRSVDRPLGAAVIAEETSGGEQRGVVPHLSIRCTFIVLGNQRATRLDDPVADSLDESVLARRQDVGSDADLEQPDGLEVRAEKQARRAE